MKAITQVIMKRVCIFLTLCLIPVLGNSQQIGDTIIVFVEGRAEVKVAVPDYDELRTSAKPIDALREFRELIPEIANQLSTEEADLVKINVGGSITIEPGDPKITFLNNEGTLSYTGFREQAILYGDQFTIFITTAEITGLVELDLAECLKKTIAKLPKRYRWSKTISYECVGGEVKEINNANNEYDMLEIQAGAGAGLIKSNWVADISFGVSLGLNHKGIPRSPYISANMIFDFDAEDKMNINTFLNLGYSFNVGDKSKKPSMLGVELGYLIAQQGEMFGDNTFKLGVNWSPAKHIVVSPTLYVTDNFSQAFPGVRIGFGF